MNEASISPIDVLDVLAVILGIIYSLRRQWVVRRESDDFPGVAPELFDSWRIAATKAYSLLMNACFGKLILDFLWFYAGRGVGMAPELLRYGAMAIDLGWLVLLFWGLTLRRKALQLRQQLPPPREAR